MRYLIKTAVAAIGALAFSGGAAALESGFTCDAEDYTVPQTVVDGAPPAPAQQPADTWAPTS